MLGPVYLQASANCHQQNGQHDFWYAKLENITKESLYIKPQIWRQGRSGTYQQPTTTMWGSSAPRIPPASLLKASKVENQHFRLGSSDFPGGLPNKHLTRAHPDAPSPPGQPHPWPIMLSQEPCAQVSSCQFIRHDVILHPSDLLPFLINLLISLSYYNLSNRNKNRNH